MVKTKGSSAPPKGSDRRRYFRWDVNLPIRMLHPEQHVLRATSLSAGGLFCPEAGPTQEGSEILLELDLLGGKQPVQVEAKVVHVGKWEGFGLGLEFTQPVSSIADYLSGSTPTPEDIAL